MTQEVSEISKRHTKLELHCTKPTAVGCNYYNKISTFIKQYRNNCLFKKRLKELLIKECYYSTEECMNEVFINIGF